MTKGQWYKNWGLSKTSGGFRGFCNHRERERERERERAEVFFLYFLVREREIKLDQRFFGERKIWDRK